MLARLHLGRRTGAAVGDLGQRVQSFVSVIMAPWSITAKSSTSSADKSRGSSRPLHFAVVRVSACAVNAMLPLAKMPDSFAPGYAGSLLIRAPDLRRSSNVTPSSRSRLPSASLSAGWDRCNDSPARRNDPCWITAARYSSCSMRT